MLLIMCSRDDKHVFINLYINCTEYSNVLKGTRMI